MSTKRAPTGHEYQVQPSECLFVINNNHTSWQPNPQPSISVTPSNVVALGGNVSIHCMSENYLQMEFYLEKDERESIDAKEAEQPEVIFPILNAKAEDGGTYQCIYHSITGEGPWSVRSDKIYINVTDPSLIKPSIKLQGEPFVGMTVTIECQGPEHNLTFSLHKSRSHTATQVIPPTGSTNHFPFHTLSLEDAGNYTCQYHRRENPFVWSGPSDSVKLAVIDPKLKKPSILVQGKPVLGKYVTIECQTQGQSLIFSLHKSRNLTAVQMVEAAGDTGSFLFHMLSLEDAGNYTCRYHHKGEPFIWSEPSDPVELVLPNNPEQPFQQDHASAVTNIRQSAAVLVSLVLVLIVVEAVYSWKKGQL
ncbi:T-cell-interacting, activating receptor on myeloid cells protein 1-like [Tiliqua scincoides]|uniref:T-cell-interacting, activating receptor on myeloid cells protein 1-like n=1 Tax=Tiliqua scincoides TaxID=71010 RepID=UPI0034636720